MTVFRREADRLDTYLDDQMAGRAIDPDDLQLDPTLIDTWTWATTAMAHTPSDPTAKSQTWRTIMHAQSVTATPFGAPSIPVRRPALPEPRGRSHRALALAGAGALVLTLAGGIVGYDRLGNGGGPTEPRSIPAALYLGPGTPEPTGCDIAPREPGAIEQIMESPQTLQPRLPRFNADPVYFEMAQPEEPVDGESLMRVSSPDDSVTASIQQALDRAVACRAYALDATGRPDLTGRYFANFSDDFFRRELSGYREAGLEPQLVNFWAPPALVDVLETREIGDGERYVVVLGPFAGTSPEFAANRIPVVIVVPDAEYGWKIDEVGFMTAVEMNDAGTPIVDTADVSDSPQIVAFDRYPHELTVAVADIVAANEDPWICDVAGGTPVPCTSGGIFRFGPWNYNELPAGTPFSYTFVNTSETATRISSPELGIDVELPAGQQVTVEVDAAPGSYDVVFTQGDATSTWTFQFEPEDGQFSMG